MDPPVADDQLSDDLNVRCSAFFSLWGKRRRRLSTPLRCGQLSFAHGELQPLVVGTTVRIGPERESYRPPNKRQDPHPAALVISRIDAKFNALRSIDARHAQWVDEALVRIDEEVFHPAWDGFIQLSEIRN